MLRSNRTNVGGKKLLRTYDGYGEHTPPRDGVSRGILLRYVFRTTLTFRGSPNTRRSLLCACSQSHKMTQLKEYRYGPKKTHE